jgi:ATP-binding cassette subfamily B protein
LDRALEPGEERHILEASQFSHVVERLPAGLDTRVGGGGTGLSAGERQLLSFARVLAKNPPILVLDEATSSVDSATELLIEKAIRATLTDRTALVIAHRLSTVRRADRILVMERGRIAESGTHEELLAAGGIYYHLYNLQTLERQNGEAETFTPVSGSGG